MALSVLATLSFVMALAVTASPAQAQATRTWVSGVGDDANPCSRTAPCKTFAGAISKTAVSGEINCLDPGGFGAVTITKSISIICDNTIGGVLASSGVNGIIINLPAATDTVFLSGLDLNGAGSGLNGIRIISAGNVHVQNCIIRNFRAANGQGMSVQPSGALNLTVFDTTIDDNGVAGAPGTGGGILIQPTGAGGTAKVTLKDVRIQNNGNNGLFANTTGNTGAGVTVEADVSTFTGNSTGIGVLTPVGAAVVVTTITNSSVVNNGTAGMTSNGANAFLRVGNTTITGNTLGVSATNGGSIQTYGNNRLVSNPSVGGFANGAFTAAAPPPL
jgi:hypothetical protein